MFPALTYLQKADTVVGYTFQAETLCKSCTYNAALADWDPWVGPEAELDAMAARMGIDREDQTTFDSDDFPKVIFASDVDGDTCDGCGEEL